LRQFVSDDVNLGFWFAPYQIEVKNRADFTTLQPTCPTGKLLVTHYLPAHQWPECYNTILQEIGNETKSQA